MSAGGASLCLLSPPSGGFAPLRPRPNPCCPFGAKRGNPLVGERRNENIRAAHSPLGGPKGLPVRVSKRAFRRSIGKLLNRSCASKPDLCVRKVGAPDSLTVAARNDGSIFEADANRGATAESSRQCPVIALPRRRGSGTPADSPGVPSTRHFRQQAHFPSRPLSRIVRAWKRSSKSISTSSACR